MRWTSFTADNPVCRDTHACARTHLGAHMFTHAHSDTYMCMHAHSDTYMCTHAHSDTCMCTHAHRDTHVHARTQRHALCRPGGLAQLGRRQTPRGARSLLHSRLLVSWGGGGDQARLSGEWGPGRADQLTCGACFDRDGVRETASGGPVVAQGEGAVRGRQTGETDSRQTDRQTDRQTETQAEREADGQAECLECGKSG